MGASARQARNFLLLGAVVAFWLTGGQVARAGGGGADFAGIQNYINGICSMFGVTDCPELPTISQGILELSALYNSTPEAGRSQFAIPVAPYVDAANPSRPPAVPKECATASCVDPLNPIIGLPMDPSVLSTLRPLAFISAKTTNGTAVPTQLSDTDANIFFYVVGGRSSGSTVALAEPDTLLLFYEIVSHDEDDNRIRVRHPLRASFSLPLTVLNGDLVTERAVTAILQYTAPGPDGNMPPAPCSASTITGSFSGNGTQTLTPAALGINCAVAFGVTPLSPRQHAVFEISIPLLVTLKTDYVVVNNPFGFFPSAANSGAGNAFPDDNDGFQPASCPGANCILGADGHSIGIAPSAGPLGPAVTASSSPATYSLCANLPTKGPFAPVPAVAAFYAIAANGADVLLSTPLAPTPPGIVCPAM